ncbi:MAG TPA: response regulator [Terriglobales bacterium]
MAAKPLQFWFRGAALKAIRPATILAVDDNEMHLYAVKRILSHAGFTVAEASNGTQALDRVREKPDLIILDVNLPDGNGFEICKSLKQNPETAGIPVVFLSSTFDQAWGKQWAQHLGAQEFLAHPILADQLTAIVNGVLSRHTAGH